MLTHNDKGFLVHLAREKKVGKFQNLGLKLCLTQLRLLSFLTVHGCMKPTGEPDWMPTVGTAQPGL